MTRSLRGVALTNSSSAVLPRVGAQRPTHLLTPEGSFDFTDGDVAIDLAEQLGLELYDWQRWAVRWILALDEYGEPAVKTAIINVPRQNGKGAVLEALELFWLIVAEVPVVIHTAHEADTSAGHMERIEGLTADPDIELPTIKTHHSNGKEKTRNLDALPRPAVLGYKTRTKATKRGASPQRVILDEAQELQPDHINAIFPGMAAQSMDLAKMPQSIYTGSAPLEHSFYWSNLIDKALETKPAATFVAQWASDPDVDIEDVDQWYRVNPLMGLRISEQWVRDAELLVMTPEGFATERLGVPRKVTAGGAGPISTERWGQLADAESMATDDTLSLGLSAPLDRSTACFSVYGRRADGAPHAAIRYWVKPEDIGQVVEVAKQLADGHGVQINVPPNDPAAAWLDDLESAGVAVNQPTSADLVKAEQAIEQEVADGTLRHRGQIDMATAVGGLAARTSGDSSPWSRRSSTSNIAPLMALAAARAGGPGEKPAEFFAY